MTVGSVACGGSAGSMGILGITHDLVRSLTRLEAATMIVLWCCFRGWSLVVLRRTWLSQ